MNRYASRKFLLALASLAINAWLLVEQAISGNDYKLIVLGTVGAYIAGNVMQKATAKNEQTAP